MTPMGCIFLGGGRWISTTHESMSLTLVADAVNDTLGTSTCQASMFSIMEHVQYGSWFRKKRESVRGEARKDEVRLIPNGGDSADTSMQIGVMPKQKCTKEKTETCFIWEAFLYFYHELRLFDQIGPAKNGEGPVEQVLHTIFTNSDNNYDMAWAELKNKGRIR